MPLFVRVSYPHRAFVSYLAACTARGCAEQGQEKLSIMQSMQMLASRVEGVLFAR